jgi:hypothetical protein
MSTGDSREHFEQRLTAALDHRGALGEPVRFWWRDDDAVRTGPMLQRLFEAVEGAPLALAVIPEPAQTDLVEAVAREPGVTVFQHGWAHVNHAPRGQSLGAWELDGFRPAEQVLAEMHSGKMRLEKLFGERFQPIMVPPWNRVHAGLLPALAAHGFVGISGTGEGIGTEPVPGLRCINCQVDVLRWKDGARFAGWKKSADELVTLLMDPAEQGTIGINTHHAVTDREGWEFIASLNRLVSDHPAAAWVPPQSLFAKP